MAVVTWRCNVFGSLAQMAMLQPSSVIPGGRTHPLLVQYTTKISILKSAALHSELGPQTLRPGTRVMLGQHKRWSHQASGLQGSRTHSLTHNGCYKPAFEDCCVSQRR